MTTSSQQTPSTSLADRVLILGLDGATWDVLTPLMDAGRMPNLRRLVAEGASGILDSTVPPITPAAWTTFMTGKTPGTHGIIDFERYDVRTNRLSFNTTRCLDARTIWRILGDAGRRVGVIHVPMTFPPSPVNGFLISGFETPTIDAQFTYPPELKDDLLRRFPDYSYRTKWRHSAIRRRRTFEDNLDYVTRSFDQGARLARVYGDQYGWDVLMVVLKLVDNLQHKTWKYLDPRTRGRWPKHFAAVTRCFEALDRAIGDIADYARKRGATLWMMSDHGHGSLEGTAQPNLMLRDWGYLRLREAEAGATVIRRLLQRQAKRKKGKFAAGSFSIEHDLAVDLSATRACVMHAGMAGFLYINLHGRQETGIVDPGDYERLRDELRERFLAERCVDPSGRSIAVFPEVHKPEELYGCSRAEGDWLPDLLLTPARNLSVVRRIRGRRPVRWLPLRRMEGTHRPEGVFLAHGPGVAAGVRLRAGIIDCPPTLLAMLGLPVPDDMEGRVIAEMFVRPVEVRTERAVATSAAAGDDDVYSEADKQVLVARLTDLGYLE